METHRVKGIGSNTNGMALLVCLAIISILAAAGLELGRRVRSSTDLAIVIEDSFRAEEMALAGINLAMVILAEDRNSNEIDSVQESWANPETIQEAVASLGYDTEKITLSIVDELGKIQVNALLDQFPGNNFNNDQKELWEGFLNTIVSADKSGDKRDPAEIINSLKDWLDSEDDEMETGVSGAESSYYENLIPPYNCTNGPFDLLDEIFLVRGVPRNLLEIEKVEGFENIPMEFSETFTVFGMDDKESNEGSYKFSGTININTANINVIAALLPSGLQDQAQELIDYRVYKQEEHGEFVNTLERGWYKKIIGLSQKEEELFNRLIRYSSDIFSATCSATAGKTQKSITACITRVKDKETNRWVCRIIRLSRD